MPGNYNKNYNPVAITKIALLRADDFALWDDRDI